MPANSSSRPSSSGIDDGAVTDAAAQRVRDGLGLFRHLFRHERRPAALVGGRGIPQHFERLDLDRAAREVGDRDAVGRDRDDLVLTDRERAGGCARRRRRRPTRGSSRPRRGRSRAASCGGRRRRGPGCSSCIASRVKAPSSRADGRPERRDEVAAVRAVLAAEQDRGHLGVGLAAERVALGDAARP